MQILPQLVRDVLSDYNGTLASGRSNRSSYTRKVGNLAQKYGLTIKQITDITAGRYDRIAQIDRTAKKNVRVNNSIMLYDQKGYEKSGKSLRGTIEMSDDGFYLKCHECGEWHANLGYHVREHKMTAKEYKKAHGLKKTSALVNEPMRQARVANAATYNQANMIAARRARAKKANAAGRGKSGRRGQKSTVETLNAKRQCSAQSLHDLRALTNRLKRAPGIREIIRSGINVNTLKNTYGSWKKAVKMVCNYPIMRPPQQVRRWYSDEELIRLLQTFREKYKRPPFQSDSNRGLLPSVPTFIKRFGSWNNALSKAGYPVYTNRGQATWAAVKAKQIATMLNAPPPVMRGSQLFAASGD